MIKITATVRKTINRFGIDVYRIRAGHPKQTQLEFALGVLLGASERLRIVQVGANDGRISDPIYEFASHHAVRTDLLLIEPQLSLHPYLLDSYRGHPSALISGTAIGPPGSLCLYAIKSDSWQDCDPPYGRQWPIYRAPTGITSTERSHVVSWADRYYKGPLPVSQIIEEVHVESSPLMALMERLHFDHSVDLLQVDAEGYDDEVLYHSSLESIRPRLINFEHAHLGSEASSQLSSYLECLGYSLTRNVSDTLCVRNRR